MTSNNMPEQLINFFSQYRTRIIECFSIEALSFKHKTIRKDQIWMDLKSILFEFDSKLNESTPDEQVLAEIEHLKSSLKQEIITNNKNRPLDRYTSNAIESNFKTLLYRLNTISANYNEVLVQVASNTKQRFSDVKVKNIELSLFIILASKYGLISYNDVSDKDKAENFSILTNFSANSIRNFITGENKTNPNLLSLKQENLDNLKAVLDKITEQISSMSIK